MDWCDGIGPDDAFLIMILLDRSRGGSSDANAVATHDDRLQLAGGIQVLRYGNTRDLVLGLTVVTADGALSAQFEHTVIITKGEPIILTLP